jgi:hypothetical protein
MTKKDKQLGHIVMTATRTTTQSLRRNSKSNSRSPSGMTTRKAEQPKDLKAKRPKDPPDDLLTE